MASLKEFPKALYKGNSVNVKFNVEDKDTGEAYIFQVGDTVRVGIKSSLEDTTYILYKEFTITESGDSMALILTPEETEISVTEATLNVFLYNWIWLEEAGNEPAVPEVQPDVSLLYQLEGTSPIL